MTVDDLMCQLSDANIRVRLTQDGLRVTNASALTDELRAGLKEHKEQIIKELSMPFIDLVLLVFGGVEVNEKGQPVKAKQQDGRLLEAA